MKKDDKEREREIKKARENTVKSIDKIMDPKRKIGGCFLATHVAKFSDSTIPADVAWYCDEPKQPDMPYLSYLSVRTDDIDGIYGTAANMSAVKLLCTASGRAWCADDNEQLQAHLQKDDDLAKEIFGSGSEPYEAVRSALLSIPKCPPPDKTSDRLSQVYFPVGNGKYHLLSVLPSSVVMNEIGRRYQNISRLNAEAREKGGQYSILNDTVPLKFGGSKPQNVSAINSCAPGTGFPALCGTAPSFRQRTGVSLLRGDFFRHCYYTAKLKDDFVRFFRAFASKDKMKCLEARDHIFDSYIEEIYQLRSLEPHWSDREDIHLDVPEQHLFDIGYEEMLEKADLDYFGERAQAFARRLSDRILDKKESSFNADDAYRLIGWPFIKELRLCFA